MKEPRSERKRLLDVRRIPSQSEAGEVDLLRCMRIEGKNKKVDGREHGHDDHGSPPTTQQTEEAHHSRRIPENVRTRNA